MKQNQVDMNELVRRIRQYMGRADNDRNVRAYPLEQEGIYEIIRGSTSEYGGRQSLGFFEGRFVDVVATALLHPNFCGWYCSAKDAWNINHGYVRVPDQPVPVQVAKVNGLPGYVNQSTQLENQKLNLENQLEGIKEGLENLAR